MAFKARACSNFLYLRRRNHRLRLRLHLHLLILLLLASFSITIANIIEQHRVKLDASHGVTDPYASDDDDSKEPPEKDQDQPPSEGWNSQQCPGTVEFHCPPDFAKLRGYLLTPVIRERLRGLLKEALTIASAAAHTIDLLKLLNESNPELNRIRDVVHKGAQDLADAFEKIPHHMY